MSIDPFTVRTASWVNMTSSTDMGQILHTVGSSALFQEIVSAVE